MKLKIGLLVFAINCSFGQQTSSNATNWGTNVTQNSGQNAGGYVRFTPITYNPFNGSPCMDQYGNYVQQPLPTPGATGFGPNDIVLWNSLSPILPPNGSRCAVTTLAGNINSSVTTIPVTSGVYIQNNNVIQIDSETMWVLGGGGTTSLTVSRAYSVNGNTVVATSHTSGSPIGNIIPVNLLYGVNTNGYMFARGGFATDQNYFNSIQSFTGGVQGITFVAAGFYAAGSTVCTVYNGSTCTATTTLATASYVGGHIETGHSNGPPAVGTIATVSNPLAQGEGLISGMIYYDDILQCESVYSSVSGWSCIGGMGGGTIGGTITSTQIGYGASANTLAGSANFVFTGGNTVTLAGSFVTNTTSGGFDASVCTAYNCVQAPSGGMYSEQFSWLEMAAPGVSASGKADIYADSTAHRLKYSENGSSYVTVASTSGALVVGDCVQVGSSGVDLADAGSPCSGSGGSGTVANCGTQYGIAYYAATGTTVSCSNLLLWNPGTPQVSLAGNFQTNGTSYGFDASTCTNYNCFQAPSGGLGNIIGVHAVSYLQPGTSSGVPSLLTGDAWTSGAMYWDTSLGSLQMRDGSCWFYEGGGELDVVNPSCQKWIVLAGATGVGAIVSFANTAGGSVGVGLITSGTTGGSIIVNNSSGTTINTFDQNGITVAQTAGSNAISAFGAYNSSELSITNTSTSTVSLSASLNCGAATTGSCVGIQNFGTGNVMNWETAGGAFVYFKPVTGAPTGACNNGTLAIRTDGAATGAIGYYCYSATWHVVF